MIECPHVFTVLGFAGMLQIIELRLDFLANLNPARDLPKLVAACPVPAIVTFRPKWEG